MVQNAGQMSDNDFFFAYLSDYLDDQISGADQKRFDALLEKPEFKDLPERFKTARGHMQVALQSFALHEDQMHSLRALVEDDASRATHEATNIETVGRWEFWGNLGRRLGILGFLLAAVFALVYYVTPPKKAAFRPLESLVYEAIAMEEDPDGRLDFPTNNLKEIQDYFNSYPELGFRVPNLKVPAETWQPEGAAIIDYDTAKIAASQFTNAKIQEKLFFFMYDGSVTQLPKAEPGNYKGLLYQTYTSEKVNIVTWQVADGVVGMVVGHRSGPELADFAKSLMNF